MTEYKYLILRFMSRKTLILGGALIALVVLAYAYQGPIKKWRENSGKAKNILANVDADKIEKIEITSANGKTTLSRSVWPSSREENPQTVKWKYNDSKDFYADPRLIASALAAIKQAAGANIELVSNNKEKKSEFKTDGSNIIKIYQTDNKNFEFALGESAGFNNSYISGPPSPNTYTVKADLTGAFNKDEWRDLTIFSTDKEKIKKIRLQYPNREFTVEYKNDKWEGILPEKFAADKAKVDKILGIMADLKASAIPEQSFKNTGLDKHLIIIEALGQEVDNVLMVGDKKGELYYAKRGDSDNIYLIEKTKRDELDKWIWQLK